MKVQDLNLFLSGFHFVEHGHKAIDEATPVRLAQVYAKLTCALHTESFQLESHYSIKDTGNNPLPSA